MAAVVYRFSTIVPMEAAKAPFGGQEASGVICADAGTD